MPKADGLVIHFGVSKQDQLSRLRTGHYSLALNLPGINREIVRRDPALSGGYHEVSTLHTSMIIFNTRQGIFQNREVRCYVAQHLPIAQTVREVVGRNTTLARTFLPPTLLGDEGYEWTPPSEASNPRAPLNVEVVGQISPPLEPLMEPFTRELGKLGIRARFKVAPHSKNDLAHLDLLIAEWWSDYPDPDSFIHGVLHSESGALGQMCGSQELDNLASLGRKATDPAQRQIIYRDVESFLAIQAILIPLFHGSRSIVARPEVRGFSELPATTNGIIDLSWLWIQR
jgi:ABC-type oligopeptide transport system substrate-binding subunit